jgi:hypothetical protein
MYNPTDTLGWLAGGFYVLVALSVVYLYFFRIVPLIFSKSNWDLWGIVRSTVVSIVVAFLLGCVAIYTADWIFSKVFDILPTTRMAQEIDRLTGSLFRFSVDTYKPTVARANPYFNSENFGYAPSQLPGGTPGVPPPMTGATPGAPLEQAPTRTLKPNALDLWASSIQTRFNPTGNVTDNTEVMYPRDIPQGVRCEVAATSSGWERSHNEKWELVCTMDDFQTRVTIPVNGTAARGLTGGDFYSKENPYTVYGTGPWPEFCYEPLPTPTEPGESTPQGGPSGEATPAAPALEHKVEPGESLAMIAQRYNVAVPTLVTMNQQKYPQLKANPNVIVVGWVLAIPEK